MRTSGRYGPAWGQVGRLFGRSGTAAALAEGSLLERFARLRDEAAFEALVARHGPMVLGVCRRALDRPDDVEDAFQATFLVLARRAGSIRDGDRLGPWLHGVARRVAARARARSARHRSLDLPPALEPSVTPDAGSNLEAAELRSTLDDELARLPEKYRAPLVLCYLEGLTHDEAAVHLGWPVGTVRSRLAGGRDRLRSRLARRGLSPSSVPAMVLPDTPVAEALISASVRLATAAGTSIPAHVANLAKGALVAMIWNKFMSAATLGLSAGLLVAGAGALARQGGDAKATSAASSAPLQGPPGVEGATGARPESDRGAKARAMETALIKDELVSTKAMIKSVDARIKNLERYSAQLRATADELERSLSDLDRKSTPPPTNPEFFKKGEPAQPVGIRPPSTPGGMAGTGGGMGGASRPGPISMQLMNGPKILLIPAARDRAVILDGNTGTKETFRLPNDLTQVIPIVGFGGGSLQMVGPKIDQIAAFDADGKWYPQPLVEPASGRITPVVGAQSVYCQVGRFIYVFSARAHKWGVLEMKKAPAAGSSGPGMDNVQGVGSGKIIVTEGDIVHIYSDETAEWTHLDIKDDE